VSGPAPPGSDAAAGDLLPLTQRVLATMALRPGLIAGAAGVAVVSGTVSLTAWAVPAMVYLLLTGALSALVLLPRRSFGMWGFRTSLLIDAVAVQCAHHVLGASLGADILVTTLLVSVCLLGSFRTGVRLAVWQSLLFVMDQQGTRSGLFPPQGPGNGNILPALLLLWLAVLATAVAGAVNERELRRRRYDAEALQRFAATLHTDDEPRHVMERAFAFVLAELDASRALMCTEEDGRLRLLHGYGVAHDAPAESSVSSASTFLAGTGTGTPRLTLRLDPSRDPWLATLLPDAHRVIGLRMEGSAAPVWLLFEHAGQRGIRVERRLVSTAAQVASIATLALSRAELLASARTAALTDVLTGVANRRAFDAELVRRLALAAQDPAAGFSLVLTDIDHFKAVNDRHGHGTGDEVLRAVGAALAQGARSDGVVARYGGEEFAVLLATADGAEAVARAEALRVAVTQISEPLAVTASFGVATYAGVAATAKRPVDGADLVRAADEALYRAKRDGRNRVEAATPVPGPRVHG
jgi:two-component system cell cycle response regulator